ncbi:MAG: bifunctional phosphoglucose/phosphomannose isomerase, partial [Chloroflexi bacterium]|nr:bifunctional phosphoglucose/phosphomannose isomerase [Chloroflexota bacterium]
MDLDNQDRFAELDSDGMLRHIDGLATQFHSAWRHAQSQPLPSRLDGIRQIVVSGMGGSAIGGDLLAAATANRMHVPVTVVRGYELPAWVRGQETLVIASSFSGNTEETLSAYEQAKTNATQIIGITTGGQLAEQLASDGYTTWTFPGDIGHPRAAIGWSFGLLLGLASRAGWVEHLEAEVREATALLETQQAHYTATTPVNQNPAKNQARALAGRMPVIIGAGSFEPIARRWKTQLNENSKIWSVWEPLPELNHNVVVGIEYPEPLMPMLGVIVIQSPQFDHPRVALRQTL